MGTRPPLQLGVCAIFRNEAPYLAEWVTFHRLQGVERFWLYDNLSDDDWQDELGSELESGLIRVTPWRDLPGQCSAYTDCLIRHRADARWIAFIDVDEFLFSPTGAPLPTVLARFQSTPGVVVNWRTYGTGGLTERPLGLVIENYLMRPRDDHFLHRHVKSIVYPPKTQLPCTHPHYFGHYGRAVGEDGAHHGDTAFRDPPTADLLRINHYKTKSLSEFHQRLALPRADCDQPRLTDPPPDDVRDESILRWVPALKAALAHRELAPAGTPRTARVLP